MLAFDIREAAGDADLAACRELFLEYQQGTGATVCFGGFDREVAGLPGEYAAPHGGLWLAVVAGAPAGCVALRTFATGEAEMKRLYVRSSHRGLGLGRALALRAIGRARESGAQRLRLDTLQQMTQAQALYVALGFVSTERYNDNAEAGVRFMALELATG